MKKMESGMDSTLGNWLIMTEAFFGVGTPPAVYLRDKIVMSEVGRNEEVTADEGQFIHVLGRMMIGTVEA